MADRRPRTTFTTIHTTGRFKGFEALAAQCAYHSDDGYSVKVLLEPMVARENAHGDAVYRHLDESSHDAGGYQQRMAAVAEKAAVTVDDIEDDVIHCSNPYLRRDAVSEYMTTARVLDAIVGCPVVNVLLVVPSVMPKISIDRLESWQDLDPNATIEWTACALFEQHCQERGVTGYILVYDCRLSVNRMRLLRIVPTENGPTSYGDVFESTSLCGATITDMAVISSVSKVPDPDMAESVLEKLLATVAEASSWYS